LALFYLNNIQKEQITILGYKKTVIYQHENVFVKEQFF